MEIRYNVLIEKPYELFETKLVENFPTIVVKNNLEHANFMIIYQYVKDKVGNYIITREYKLDKTLLYWLNIRYPMSIYRLKSFLEKILEPNTFYSNMNNIEVKDEVIYNNNKYRISNKFFTRKENVITSFKLELIDGRFETITLENKTEILYKLKVK